MNNIFDEIKNTFRKLNKSKINLPQLTIEQFHMFCKIVIFSLKRNNVLNIEKRKIAILVLEQATDEIVYNNHSKLDLKNLHITIEVLGELKKLDFDSEKDKKDVDLLVQFLKELTKEIYEFDKLC